MLDWLQETMRTLRFTGPLYVMGRSMGRHSAGELAITAADRINGVIIESGRPNLGRIAEGLEPGVVQALEDDYQAKFYSIDIPALVIHGQWDESAPLADAVDMFNKLETAHKHLEIIPGAGHNDLMYVGFQQYFNAHQGLHGPVRRAERSDCDHKRNHRVGAGPKHHMVPVSTRTVIASGPWRSSRWRSRRSGNGIATSPRSSRWRTGYA